MDLGLIVVNTPPLHPASNCQSHAVLDFSSPSNDTHRQDTNLRLADKRAGTLSENMTGVTSQSDGASGICRIVASNIES